MTQWTEFIKDFAKKNNVSYGCAMTDPKLREEYYKKYPKKTKEDVKKEDAKKASGTRALALKNFRDKFVKPHLEKPDDKRLKNNMLKKFKNFSQEFKDFIKEKAPKIFKIVN